MAKYMLIVNLTTISRTLESFVCKHLIQGHAPAHESTKQQLI